MSAQNINEPLLDLFIFETTHLLEQLEQIIIISESNKEYSQEDINEIFRIMHTIKGSSAMMMFQNISTIAHTIEDVFFFLREQKPNQIDNSQLSDLILESVDFIKSELDKITNNELAGEDGKDLIEKLNQYLCLLKQQNTPKGQEVALESIPPDKQQYYISQKKSDICNYQFLYKAIIFFEEGCEMENIRAYTIVHDLQDITKEIYYAPKDIIENEECIEKIRKEGFLIYLKADDTYEKIHEFFMKTVFLKDLELIQLEEDDQLRQFILTQQDTIPNNEIKIPEIGAEQKEEKSPFFKENHISSSQSIISVSVLKLDKLMDLMGEMVIAEAMVIENPDLKRLNLDNFQKAARQLNKITGEMQDMIMAIRMVPLSATFQKMHRLVRDMSKKLNKEIKLEIIGEETEVDKNIIEHISDPLMHLVRNSIDHGMEANAERIQKGKPSTGKIILEAKNSGSDVLIIVRDDGKGLNKETIIQKAKANGLLTKSEEEMSDKEIFNLIFLPGFSTKESVTEFSGRGVGMDVVMKNIESVGGSLLVDSTKDKGTLITLKIPLTLAIIDGMNIKVGNSYYTIPIISIKESFRPKEKDIITDPDGNEMIMVRGNCYKILRLHERFQVKTDVTSFHEGIFIIVQQEEDMLCIFADGLIGQQQVVVKSLPEYILKSKKINGLAGCTLLGDGSISLILDIAGLMN